MAAENFAQALALLLVHEGGKTDDPHDPGGRTNWGITHIDYDTYRRSKGLPLRDVFLMDPSERDDIYRSMYWNVIRGDDLPPGLDYVVFDGGVNSGNGQSIKWLQRALPALPANGRINDALIGQTSQCADVSLLIKAACEARREFLQNLNTFQYFGRGWMKRVDDVQTTALAWASGIPAAVPAATSSGSQPKALRESGAALPSTAPGDIITAASGALLAATLALHVQTAPVAPAPPASSQPAVTQSALSTSQSPISATSTPVTSATQPTTAATIPAQVTTLAPSASNTAATTPSPSAQPTPAQSAPAVVTANNVASTTASSSVPSSAGSSSTAVAVSTPAGAPQITTPPAAPASQPAPNAGAVSHTNASTPPSATPTVAPSKPSAMAATAPSPAAGAATNGVPLAPSKPVVATPAVNTPHSLLPAVIVESGPASTAKSPSPAPAWHFTASQYGLAGAFLVGLFMSFSSRAKRTRRLDALGDTARPKTKLKTSPASSSTRAAKAQQPSRPPPPPAQEGPLSIPIVRSVYARILTGLWIFITIAVNVIVLAKLLQSFGFAHESWHQPFLWLGNLYDTYAGQAFAVTQKAVSAQFGFTLPVWILPAFVLYVSTASAFVAASSGLMQRDSTGESFFAAVLHAGWIFAVPSFVINAVRYRVVTRFARQNTALFFAYLFSFLVVYIAARFINDDILPGFAKNEMVANPDATIAALKKELNAIEQRIP